VAAKTRGFRLAKVRIYGISTPTCRDRIGYELALGCSCQGVFNLKA
jgi:hypothetical protein